MDKGIRWKIVVCALITIVSIFLVIPTLWMLNHPNGDATMPKWMPKTAMKLGLDLRGGVHMVMGVDLDKVVRGQLTANGHSLSKAVKEKEKIDVKTQVISEKFELEVTAASPADVEKVAAEVSKSFDGLQVVGQTGNVIVLRLTSQQESYVRQNALDQSIETIRNRIDEFGVSEPIISRKGDNQILVQFPGEQEPERLKSLIGQTAQLSFAIVHECREGSCLAKQREDLDTKIKAVETKGNYNRDTFKRFSEYRDRLNTELKDQLPADTTIAFQRVPNPNVKDKVDYMPMLLSTKDVVSGEYIENAFVTLESDGFGPQTPQVAFQMNAAGGPMFGKLTTDFVRHYMAIVLDGNVKSFPVINTPITQGSGRITLGNGNYDEVNQEAKDLAIVLRAGALPASIESQEERVIGPSMGQDAIQAGKLALAVAACLIFIFMCVYYGKAGFIGSIAIAVNIAAIFAILGSVSATLTLPGIAGIVLTMGMAVDALIIIYERMREELRAGHARRQIIHLGFDRAFATILDSNVTTAMGALVLLNYGTGSIRGFALTLLVGITTNVVIATFFTRTLFEIFFSDTSHFTVGLSEKEMHAVTA